MKEKYSEHIKFINKHYWDLMDCDIKKNQELSECEQMCIDIYNDYNTSEIKKEPLKIQFVWELGRNLISKKS